MLSSTLWPAQMARCRLEIRPKFQLTPCSRHSHHTVQAALPLCYRRRPRPPAAQPPEVDPIRNDSSSSDQQAPGQQPFSSPDSDAPPAPAGEAADEQTTPMAALERDADNQQQQANRGEGQTAEGVEEEEEVFMTAEEILAAARADIADQWRDLRAVATGRLGGTADSGSGVTASLADRLARLATGGFLADAGASQKGKQQQQQQAVPSGQKQQQQQQQQQQQVTAANAVVDVAADKQGTTAPPPDPWEEQQLRRQYEEAAAAAVAVGANSSAAVEVVEARIVPPADAGDGSGPPNKDMPVAENKGGAQQGLDDDVGGEDDDDLEGVIDVDAIKPWEVPVTSMAALATAAVTIAVWWPVRWDIWLALTNGSAREVLQQVAFRFPDTPAVLALQMDAFGVLERGEWARLLTAGLLHSGVLPAMWCISGLRNAGLWLELVCGGAQAGIVLVTSAFGATMGQMLSGGGLLAGPGVTTGAYTAWAVLALTRARGQIPVSSDQGVLWLVANMALAWWQPAIGFGCLAGGAAGGALGMLLAPLLARIAYTAVGVPVGLALIGARAVIETVWLAVQVVLRLLYTTWRAGVELVRTIRGV